MIKYSKAIEKWEINAIIIKEQWKGDCRPMQLSEVIKMTRQKAFLSQETFAKEVKVAVSTINRWEAGKSKPNLTAMRNLKFFCENHGLTYDDIEKEWFKSSGTR